MAINRLLRPHKTKKWLLSGLSFWSHCQIKWKLLLTTLSIWLFICVLLLKRWWFRLILNWEGGEFLNLLIQKRWNKNNFSELVYCSNENLLTGWQWSAPTEKFAYQCVLLLNFSFLALEAKWCLKTSDRSKLEARLEAREPGKFKPRARTSLLS